MMKHEFEHLVSTVVFTEDYEKIEKAYMHYDNLFPNKESIAQFYKLNGMSAINALCSDYDSMLMTNQPNNSLNTQKELTIDSLNELIAIAQRSTRGVTELVDRAISIALKANNK